MPSTTMSYGQTLLSARLAPPPPPPLRGPTSGQVNLWTFGAVLGALASVMWVATMSPSGMLVALVVGVAVAIAVNTQGTRARKASEARSNMDLVYYAKAMSAWDQFYYCHRDDLVFLPDQPVWGPASELGAFLLAAARVGGDAPIPVEPVSRY
jgi:hypothetical protein